MSEQPDNTVHIAVIGDSGVGKTSLITAAATETFPDRPPPVLPPAKLPAETTPEGVPVVITDTSSRQEDKQAFEAAVRSASVIVLCFAMDKPATLRRVSSHWMPELKRMGIAIPVLLVGCKSDVRPADRSLHQAVLPLVKTFPQIETCMECSARTLQFVGEVFYYALKAVVHPVAPLYEPELQQLRPACARALKCIFTLCDRDGDGVLSDAELNAFQVQCFNAPLQPEELAGVKQVVAEKLEQGIDRNGLTLAGFLFLHALFIERGRLETTWTVLRKFGYNNELRLRDDVVSKASFPGRSPDQVVELTPEGRAFFAAAFDKFDVDDDGVLSARERDEMFSTAPEESVSFQRDRCLFAFVFCL
jgi:mitochondrial Rho GTPase 1